MLTELLRRQQNQVAAVLVEPGEANRGQDGLVVEEGRAYSQQMVLVSEQLGARLSQITAFLSNG